MSINGPCNHNGTHQNHDLLHVERVDEPYMMSIVCRRCGEDFTEEYFELMRGAIRGQQVELDIDAKTVLYENIWGLYE